MRIVGLTLAGLALLAVAGVFGWGIAHVSIGEADPELTALGLFVLLVLGPPTLGIGATLVLIGAVMARVGRRRAAGAAPAEPASGSGTPARRPGSRLAGVCLLAALTWIFLGGGVLPGLVLLFAGALIWTCGPLALTPRPDPRA